MHWALCNQVLHVSFASTRSSLSSILSSPPQLFDHVCICTLKPRSPNCRSWNSVVNPSVFRWSFLLPPTFSQWLHISLKSPKQINGSLLFDPIPLSRFHKCVCLLNSGSPYIHVISVFTPSTSICASLSIMFLLI